MRLAGRRQRIGLLERASAPPVTGRGIAIRPPITKLLSQSQKPPFSPTGAALRAVYVPGSSHCENRGVPGSRFPINRITGSFYSTLARVWGNNKKVASLILARQDKINFLAPSSW